MTISGSPTDLPHQPNMAYQKLVASRNRFVILMTVIFMVLYFLLPFLAGYNKLLMATKVSGSITFGYIFAFLEFIIGWVMAGFYLYKAREFDRLAEEAKQ